MNQIMGEYMKPSLKILIVDNEVLLLELFEMMLKSEFDCETVCISDGTLALEALSAETDFSLIICDYYVTGPKGEKPHQFNQKHQNVPFFLFSTGNLDHSTEINDFKMANQLNCVFPKPFLIQEFLSAVHRVADAHAESALNLNFSAFTASLATD
jgi:DNA-binding NtrC family response regulator